MIAPTAPTGQLTLRPVGTDLHLPVRVAHNATDGSVLSLRTRMSHTMQRATDSIRLVYANWINDGGREAPGTNPIRVSAAVRTADSHEHEATFGGAARVLLEPGGQVLSDPLPIHAGAGEVLISSTLVEVDHAGERIPLGSQIPGDHESYGFGPRLILTEASADDDRLLVAVLGDSNAVGFGDGGAGTLHHGWLRRACEPDIAHINLSISGATARGSRSAAHLRHRFALLREVRPDVFVSALGTNDLADATADAEALRGDLLAHWSALQALGVPVVGCTVPPVTAPPHVSGGVPRGAEATRVAINRWIRTIPDPLSGVIDLAAAVEAPDRPGRWRPGASDDGIHFSTRGHIAVAGVARLFLERTRSSHPHQYDDRRQDA